MSILEFLRGLSKDELECIAEFEGACVLESLDAHLRNPYRLLADFFEECGPVRWPNADERAHKTFVVLEYLNLLECRSTPVAKAVQST